MRKAKIVRFIWDILIIIFMSGFVLALHWYLKGSFEVAPTEEQLEKAQIGAIVSMIATGIPCSVCIAARLLFRKK